MLQCRHRCITRRLWLLPLLSIAGSLAFAALPALAAEGTASIDSGDTAFMMFSIALVMLMIPGLGLFYGGMVRKKNVLNMFVQSFLAIALISLQWMLFGYSLAFGPDHVGLIGGLDWLGFHGVGFTPNVAYASTIPHAAFAAFQMMFAIITPALITGSFAERMRFPAFVLFVLLWGTIVYDPMAHWVWGVNGWLRNLGALDFAGGLVVHINAGVAGLVAAVVVGRRKGHGSTSLLPHNIPMTMLGAGLLWFGWFGFNAGSALAANGLAVNALVTTNTSAAAATISWLCVEWMLHRRVTVLGAVSGAVAGLGAVTPAAGFVSPLSAAAIGLVSGVICCLAISRLKVRLGYDDSLDVFGCHGIGGIWGVLATGLFASTAINPAGANGLFFGNPTLLAIQALAAAVAIGYSAGATLVVLKIVNVLMGLRVSPEEEEAGLDITQHGEQAYPDQEFTGTLAHIPGQAEKRLGFGAVSLPSLD